MPARLVAATALALLAAAGGAPAALGHAGLVGARPPDGSVLARSPASVEVTFASRVTPGDLIDAVANSDRVSVLGGRPYVKDENVLVVPLDRDLPVGDYSVRWQAVSADGHPLAGSTAFRVGTDAATRPASVFSIDNGPKIRDLVGRWLFLLGVLTLAGVLAFRVLVWLPALAATRLGQDARTRLETGERLRTCALVAGASYLVVFGAALTLVNLPERAETRFGHVAEVAIAVGAGALVGAIVVTLGLAAGPPLLRLVLPVLAVLALIAPTTAGHALAGDRPAVVTPLSDLVHSASSAVWFGGLLALAVLLPLTGQAGSPALAGRLAATVVERFSRIALWAVAAIVVSGGVRAVTGVGRPEQLWDSAYGRTVVIKTGVLLAVCAAAWVTRSMLLPRLVAAVAAGEEAQPAVVRFRRNLVCELALLTALVAAVALLTELPPGGDVDAGTITTGSGAR